MISVALKTPLEIILGICIYNNVTRLDDYIGFTPSCPPPAFYKKIAPMIIKPMQWRTQKISDGGSKFRHNRVTSQINFRGSAESTTIQGGPGACPQENFAKLHLQIRIFVHSGSKF